MNKIKILSFALLILMFSLSISSCKKYRKYEDGEVVENTFTGDVLVTSSGANPAGDFTGEGDSGKYSFVWDNSSKKAQLNFDITTVSGSVRFILRDSKGNEVLNQSKSTGDDDTFSGVSDEGKKGKWLVEIHLSNFDGDGSYSINPGD